MELERDVLVSPTTEVPVVEGELVLAIRALADCGVGSKAIARAVGVARNTVRRYLRQSIDVGGPGPTGARRLTDDRRLEARTLYEGPAGGNAVVVQRLLAERGLTVSVRTIERAVADIRRERRVAQLATVRVETAPGDQLQIDFGQKRVQIAGAGCASSSWSRSSVIPAGSLSKPSSMSARMTGAKGSRGRSCISAGCRAPCSATMRGRWSSAGIAGPGRSCFIPPIWRSAAIGTCSRARARRIGRGPKARPKPASNS